MGSIKRAILQNIYLSLAISLLVVGSHTESVLPVLFVQPIPVQPVQGGSGIGIKVTGSSGTTGSDRSSKSTQVQPIYVPELVTHTGSSYSKVCIAYTIYRTSNTYDYQMELSYAQILWSRLLPHYQLCTSSTSTTSISSYLADLWSNTYMHYLSAPTFEIPPGFGVVGVPSYVVTRFPFVQTFSNATPYGELIISARASLDLTITQQSSYSTHGSMTPSTSGPFVSSGYPWPIGGVAIHWNSPGTYSVNASLLWTAKWSLDGQSGLFSPVTTSFSVPIFQVESLQALRMSPI